MELRLRRPQLVCVLLAAADMVLLLAAVAAAQRGSDARADRNVLAGHLLQARQRVDLARTELQQQQKLFMDYHSQMLREQREELRAMGQLQGQLDHIERELNATRATDAAAGDRSCAAQLAKADELDAELGACEDRFKKLRRQYQKLGAEVQRRSAAIPGGSFFDRRNPRRY
eukprot:TRINITY_DN10702_c0_g1_i1.p1 TRINITY_DN10702_c0_g1~~TRINITY_DN10702_c0_g1_i1.p1  ORF type:complete len:198 (+),score=75.41 TRINITY_DN10702_c0_g1_i1:79-594(+)